MEPPPGAVDARSDRYAEGAVGVFLLGCFVFGFVYAVPVVAAMLGAAALWGPRADVQQIAWNRFAAPRLEPPEAFVPADTMRAQQGVLAAACAVGTLGFLVARPLGWLFVIVAALVAVLAATTGVHVGEQVRRRFNRG